MPALPRCRRARSDAGDGGSVRRETANRRGWPAALSARYSTSDTVSGSAQCRSSMATTSPSGPRRRRSRSTASPLTACESTPRPRRAAGPPATAPGSRTARCGSHARQRGIIGQRTPPQQLQQGLGHRPVRSASRGGDSPARHHQHLPVGSHPRQLPDQAGLADAGLTRDDGTAALAGERSGKGRLQRLDLGPPPHQDRAQHLPHDSSLPHRRQGRSVITRPTPARPACPTYSLRPLTAQNAPIWTAILVIGI